MVARAVERNSKLSILWLAWNGIGDIDPTPEEAPPEVVLPRALAAITTYPRANFPLPLVSKWERCAHELHAAGAAGAARTGGNAGQ